MTRGCGGGWGHPWILGALRTEGVRKEQRVPHRCGGKLGVLGLPGAAAGGSGDAFRATGQAWGNLGSPASALRAQRRRLGGRGSRRPHATGGRREGGGRHSPLQLLLLNALPVPDEDPGQGGHEAAGGGGEGGATAERPPPPPPPLTPPPAAASSSSSSPPRPLRSAAAAAELPGPPRPPRPLPAHAAALPRQQAQQAAPPRLTAVRRSGWRRPGAQAGGPRATGEQAEQRPPRLQHAATVRGPRRPPLCVIKKRRAADWMPRPPPRPLGELATAPRADWVRKGGKGKGGARRRRGFAVPPPPQDLRGGGRQAGANWGPASIAVNGEQGGYRAAHGDGGGEGGAEPCTPTEEPPPQPPPQPQRSGNDPQLAPHAPYTGFIV